MFPGPISLILIDYEGRVAEVTGENGEGYIDVGWQVFDTALYFVLEGIQLNWIM